MKKSAKDINKILIVTTFIFLAAVLFIFFRNNWSASNPNLNLLTQKPTTYQSKFLKITFDYPTKFKLEENFGTIYLKQSNNLIILDRIATNFKTIDDYLTDLSITNKILIINKKQVKINQLDAVKATIQHPNTNNPDSKVYYFYINNWVYDISTTAPALYTNLDQVAQSFRYNP